MVYKRNSHLRATPVANGYADIYIPPLVPDFSRTDSFVIIQKYVRRPDLLAYDLYGDAKFWWLFPIYNKNSIENPGGRTTFISSVSTYPLCISKGFLRLLILFTFPVY